MSKKTIYMRTPLGEVFPTFFPEYHKECENLGSGSKAYAARQEYARAELRKMIKPGQTVYCNVRTVSSSGMSRTISFYVAMIDENKVPYLRNIDGLMSDACGMSDGKNGGIVMHGSGMDMCFQGVYLLGRALFPDGFGITGKHPETGKTYTPKTAKQAAAAVKRGFVFRGRNCDASGWDRDGGYALTHSTL